MFLAGWPGGAPRVRDKCVPVDQEEIMHRLLSAALVLLVATAPANAGTFFETFNTTTYRDGEMQEVIGKFSKRAA